MATFTKNILSASTNGRAIKVAATASSGTTIHTGSTTTTTIDEVWLYVINTDVELVKLTVQWGGTTADDDDIELFVDPSAGMVLVVPGFLIKGADPALVVRAYASKANALTIHGYVNRITV
jgi:hypothetical protein